MDETTRVGCSEHPPRFSGCLGDGAQPGGAAKAPPCQRGPAPGPGSGGVGTQSWSGAGEVGERKRGLWEDTNGAAIKNGKVKKKKEAKVEIQLLVGGKESAC